jgi:hypothetical protein
MPKNIETLENIIFKFENKFTKDEPKAAAAGGELLYNRRSLQPEI